MFNKSVTILKSAARTINVRYKSIAGFETLFNYNYKKLYLEDIPIKDPYQIFKDWFREADDSEDVVNPSIMCLATASRKGTPSVRYMFCDSHDSNGFKFSTHYTSRKGEDLKENPVATACFFWAPLLKAVRIEGQVEQLLQSESDKMFDKRPYPNQIDLHCSSQKYPIESIHVLFDREKSIKEMFSSEKVPRPKNFGWYILIPSTWEFWQINERKERMRFWKPRKSEKPDNKLSHHGKNGWLYEILEP